MSIYHILGWFLAGVLIAGLLIVAAFEINLYVEARHMFSSRKRKQRQLIELAKHSKDLIAAFGNMRLCLGLAKAQLEKDHVEYGFPGDTRQDIAEIIRKTLNNPVRPLDADQWSQYLE